MTDDFYEFEHRCDEMPKGVMFLKINGSCSSQFTITQIDRCAALQTTTLFGFRYCPYCGKDMEGEGE